MVGSIRVEDEESFDFYTENTYRIDTYFQHGHVSRHEIGDMAQLSDGSIGQVCGTNENTALTPQGSHFDR